MNASTDSADASQAPQNLSRPGLNLTEKWWAFGVVWLASAGLGAFLAQTAMSGFGILGAWRPTNGFMETAGQLFLGGGAGLATVAVIGVWNVTVTRNHRQTDYRFLSFFAWGGLAAVISMFGITVFLPLSAWLDTSFPARLPLIAVGLFSVLGGSWLLRGRIPNWSLPAGAIAVVVGTIVTGLFSDQGRLTYFHSGLWFSSGVPFFMLWAARAFDERTWRSEEGLSERVNYHIGVLLLGVGTIVFFGGVLGLSGLGVSAPT